MALSDNGEKTRIVIIAVCSLIFVGIVIAEVIGFTTKSGRGEPRRNGNDNSDDNDNNNDDKNVKLSDSVKAIKSICRPTDFKRTCEEEICIEARDSTDVKEIVRAAFKAGVKFATHATKNSTSLRERVKNPRSQLALENCKLLLTYSVFELHKAISKVDELELGSFDKVLEDLKILLSATITNQQTCLHGFRNASTVYEEHMREAMMMSMRLSKIGLTITCGLSDMVNQLEFQGISHRLLGHADWSSVLDESPRKRRLLQGKEVHVLGHMDSSSMMDKNPWQRSSDNEQERLIRGHTDLSSLLDESNLWRRRLLQEKGVRVLGHMDSSSMMDKNPWQYSSDTKQGSRIRGHADLSSLLDESNRWKRRLLQEKESYVDGHDNYATILDKRRLLQEKEPDNGHYVYVDGHDDYGTTLNKRRLLQEKEPDNGHYVYVDGHDDYGTTLDKRRLLQKKEPDNGHYVYVDGHDDYGNTLDKRRLLQEKEPDNGHYVYVDGHDDYGNTLDKRRLLQEKEPDNGHYVYVDGHDDYGNTLDKRRLLQEKEPDNGHYVYVDGHDDYGNTLDKRRLLQEKEPDNGHYVYVDGHDDYGNTLDKRRLLQEKEPDNGHYVYVDGHDDYGNTLDKRRLLQEKEPDNGHYVYVDGHDDYGTSLDKRRLLQEKEPDNGHYVYVDGHDDYGTTLDKRRLLQEKKSNLDGHTNYVDRHDDYVSVLGKHHLLEENDPSKLKPDIVVAKDGSGDFKTIEDAIPRIHHNGQKPFVIYIKEGIYEENIIFNYNMTNIALIGDGKEKTRITGSLDFADGLNTFNTATVAVHGDFFFAKNIGIENTAGAAKFQAVALMVISDFAVLYNCSIDGHQNTLYVHSKRQFYRNCTVSGTIDFVFGDAAAVFQNCKFVVRKPLEGQKNVVTAQGRSDERQPTGIIIQNSTIVADDDFVNLKNRQPTFLGRPRGNFSRTIIMETFIDDLIDPEGWTVGDDHSSLKTSHFSEYNNRGPGSGTTGRVTWSAIKKLSPTEAHGFTLGKFFLGDDWIKEKGVPCTSGFSESQTRKLNMKVPFVLAADN
ncbi:hypothetical protein HRI_000228200 [Hibiscus trionum]|uniref:Pectinesterase inhibitor domain-containing protein n=1 Tax=Hibiscus trionum TaxID=183268 RepID=A0A9W7GTZ1_HIBTR|nr:hypothetical protein HRI_000228200 [Hibiscus trionum]